MLAPKLACRGLLVLAVNVALSAPVNAGLPKDAAAKAPLIGQPTGLVVEPVNITLAGPRSLQQVVISGKYADGSFRDLTHFAELSVEAPGIVNFGADAMLT